MIIWYTVTHACEALIAFHATKEKAETYAQAQTEPADIYSEFVSLDMDTAEKTLLGIYESWFEHGASDDNNWVQRILFFVDYLLTMPLIKKAHYAMDHGTLTKSPGTATKKEIESAFIKSILLN